MTDDPREEEAAEWLATAYGHGWDDPQAWKREAWREEAHALLAAVDAVDPLRREDFAALVALAERVWARHDPAATFTGESDDRDARFVAALHRALIDLDPEEGL